MAYILFYDDNVLFKNTVNRRKYFECFHYKEVRKVCGNLSTLIEALHCVFKQCPVLVLASFLLLEWNTFTRQLKEKGFILTHQSRSRAIIAMKERTLSS